MKISPLLEAKNVCKSYSIDKDINNILKSINLEIKKNECVSLMGPSGSGKSTLLYSLSGMDKITSGSVLFDGNELNLFTENELSKLRLNKMGFIFQQIHLLKNLSIFDNIIFSAYLAKNQTREHINQRALELMDKMGIAKLKHNSITEASGGQLQRAAICRALINEPIILFGDEPTGSLDSNTANDIIDILLKINQLGTTMLLATHDLKVAAKTDRVVYIIDGQLVAEKDLGKLVYPQDCLEREKQLTEWLTCLRQNHLGNMLNGVNFNENNTISSMVF